MAEERAGTSWNDASAPSEWVKRPTTPVAGRNGPVIASGGTFINSMCLGSNGTTEGDPGNNATVPAFDCGGTGAFCSVKFFANTESGTGVNMENNEQIRVTVTSGGSSVTGHIVKAGGSQEYKLSVPGCSNSVSVFFDWDAGDDATGIKSEAYLWAVKSHCDQTDQTNQTAGGGTLYKADGVTPLDDT